jgi:predicted GNAT superfamily acetyltransferase
LYVDRIAVDPVARKLGIGRALYKAVFDQAISDGQTGVTCEVNLKPPNPESMAFHSKLGFRPVGEQDTDNGAKRVCLLAKNLLESTT